MRPDGFRGILAGCGVGIAAAVAPADAQTVATDSWQFAATAYAFLPQISGTTHFPVPGAGNFDFNQSDLINNLKLAFMGAFEAHRGRWGFFTDVLYLDVGRRHTDIHDFTIGGVGIPAATTSDVSIDLKSWIANAVGEYRLLDEGGAITLDALAGLRYLSLKERLEWNFTGSLGSLPEVARSGNEEISNSIVDGIIGVKGQFRGDGGWRVPFYLDVGTGGSRFTWQGATGLSYVFQWGELGLLYRYIHFKFDSSTIEDLTISGPMVSATFRW
jgi:hypothetical protein